MRRRLVWLAPLVGAMPATAEEALLKTPSEPVWVATATAGVLHRDGDTARPFFAAGLSRRLGRFYVRAAATTYRSVTQQVDATLPSRFVLGSLGGGGTFGRWFIDGYATLGRQHYGGVVTALGTRPSQTGSGSEVWGAGLSGGRYLPLGRRLFLTPSVAVQYNADKALAQTLGPTGPREEERDERAWTGSATLRLDRWFGPGDRHLVGISLSRVETTNGAIVVGIPGSGGSSPLATRSVADGWFVAGASGSLRVGRLLWIDAAATRTIGARSGQYLVGSLGLRKAF